MFAKTLLVLTLVLSLLFVTQAQPWAMPIEMKPGGGCAGMQCALGCCANVACCKAVEQQKAPRTPISAPRSADIPLATIGLRVVALLFIPPARERPFVVSDEAGASHILSPLALNCIRLI
jgi:hypothetical protein